MKLTDTTPMPWGKHKGIAMEDVPAGYLLWCHDNDKTCPAVKAYILDNMDVLQLQRKTELLLASAIRNAGR